jgi:hypothetical protein
VTSGFAAAQTSLTVTPTVVAPGSNVNARVTGPAGQHFAIIGSAVNAGFSYGGVALAVGSDVVILAQGVLDGTGQASLGLVPPFNGTTLDRYYLQAVTSPSSSFVPLSASPGVVVRNSDVSTTVTGTTIRGTVSTLNACNPVVVATTPLTLTSSTKVFVSGRAAYERGSTNLRSGILYVRLRDSSNVQVAGTFRALGSISSGTDNARVPLSVGQVLKAHSGGVITDEDFVAAPGAYTLEMTLSGSDGLCSGTPVAWDPTVTYLLVSAQ